MKAEEKMRWFLLIPANLLALGLAWLGLQTLAENLLGWFLVLTGAAYLVGSFIFFLPRRSSLLGTPGPGVREEAGDRSFWLVIPGFVVVFFAAPLEYLYLGGAARAGLGLQINGLALILLGVALRVWTRRALKAQYTGHVQVVAGQPLQTGGPYQYIRHPGYSAFVLICLGVVVGFGSLLGAGAILLLLLPGLYYRMRVEEALLAEQYGDTYRQYAARTRRLIPGIW